MTTKEDFLNKIASKLGRPRLQEVKKPQWKRNPWDHFHQGMTQAELVDQFEHELHKLGGEVIRIPALDQLPQILEKWLEKTQTKNIVAWDQEIEVAQLFKQTLQPLTQYHLTYWNDDPQQRQQLIDTAEKADVGFTFAEQGLSETGTVMLYNRGERGRLVSLLPTICATFLSAQAIVPRITQVLAQMKGRVDEHSCINFITGPSRSADIEMDLSKGVHGPGHLVVFLIEDHLQD